MYTRFQSGNRVHLLKYDLRSKFSPHAPGALFLALLGSAYEQENVELRVQVLREAEALLWTVTTPEAEYHVTAPTFAAELEQLIAFLKSDDGPTVEMFSYDKRPSVEDILEIESQGGGGSDWAIEEMGNRGRKGRQELMKVLSDPSKSAYHISAVRLLLLVFPDTETDVAVDHFIQSCPDSLREQVTLLAAAHTKARGE